MDNNVQLLWVVGRWHNHGELSCLVLGLPTTAEIKYKHFVKNKKPDIFISDFCKYVFGTSDLAI